MTRCQYWRGRRTACVPFWMAIRSWCAAFADSSVDILLGDLFDGDSRSNGRAIVIRWCEPALCVFSEGLNGTCNNRVDSKAMLARDSWIDDIGRYFFSFPRALRLARRFGSVRPKGGGKAGGGDVDGNRSSQPSRVIAQSYRMVERVPQRHSVDLKYLRGHQRDRRWLRLASQLESCRLHAVMQIEIVGI